MNTKHKRDQYLKFDAIPISGGRSDPHSLNWNRNKDMKKNYKEPNL